MPLISLSEQEKNIVSAALQVYQEAMMRSYNSITAKSEVEMSVALQLERMHALMRRTEQLQKRIREL